MKKAIFCLVILFLSLSIIAAADTTIQVKTVPFKNINVVVVLCSGTIDAYEAERFNKNADEYGDALFTFSIDDPYFDMTIFVKDLITGDKVAYKKLERQNTGEDIYIEVVPKGFEIIETPGPEPEINETLILENETTEDTINETEEIQEDSEKKSKVSGKAIFGENDVLKKILYYAGGIVLLAIIVFFVRKFIKSRGSKKIKIKKLSELKQEKESQKKEKEEKKDVGEKQEEKQEKEEKIDDYKEAIEDAQKKIKEAQDEINKLKNRDKIKEMEKRIEDEQRELKKLKGE